MRREQPCRIVSLRVLLLLSVIASVPAWSGARSISMDSEKIVIDTDIGTDIDDAFAVALALQSPEFHILGFSTASGDTTARARILDQMLGVSGHGDIPVVAGAPTTLPNSMPPVGRQRRFGDHGTFSESVHPPAAVDFLLEQIRRFPGQITLVAIGPLTNLGALIDRDPRAARSLKRIVMMGGSISSADLGGWGTATAPTAEYNIAGDVRAAQKVFTSGIPLYVMTLDSTAQLKLDEVKRDALLSQGTPLTNSLAILNLMWGGQTPILFDAMAVAYVLDPGLCPTEPMHIVVDDSGIIRQGPGEPNARLCLHSNPETFFRFFMARFPETPP